MSNNINTKNWIRAYVLLCLLSFPSTLLAQSSVPIASTAQNGAAQSTVVTQGPSYPQVQRYQQVQNYPQVQNYAPTQAYPQLATPQQACLLYTSPSPRDKRQSRMPSSA